MRIDILTLFPEMFDGVLGASMLGRAAAGGLLEFCTHDIRAYTDNKHKKADDYPFGGGAGLVMMAQPIFDCMEHVVNLDPRPAKRILLTPRGRLLTPPLAQELARQERLVLLCGHYEGVDERILELEVDEELSVGDYVLTGGELPAAIVVDAVARLVDGVLPAAEVHTDESIVTGLLEYPQYTRPRVFEGRAVPDVLLGGDHEEIRKWRLARAFERTLEKRPELLELLKGEEPLDRRDET